MLARSKPPVGRQPRGRRVSPQIRARRCGPAAEIKEQFGGCTLVECADLDEPLTWAATMPAAAEGSVEVRPVVPVEAPS